MAVILTGGAVARYPSLDGEGIALTPHQERPDVTWQALADEFGQDVARVLRLQALAAELHHLDTCTLTEDVGRRLREVLAVEHVE